MKRRVLLTGFAATILACSSGLSFAQDKDPIRIGVITEMSGAFADYGQQVQSAINVFMKEHGDTVAGRKVEIIYRDTTCPNPEVSRRAAQELVSVEKVDFLAGFGLSPNAMGAAPI